MGKKTVYFDSYCGYSVSAVTENGKLIQFDYEKDGAAPSAGNVYRGRIKSVLAGMNAAFVDCGLERSCFLSANDAPDAAGYDVQGAESAPALSLKEGDEIPVQIVKPPAGGKGARVSARISYVGKGLIYYPSVPFAGVSRKIADAELRKNLLYEAKKLKAEGEGLIMRTAAPYAKRGQLEAELKYLRNLHAEVMRAFGDAKAGTLLYADAALPVRVLRDMPARDIEKIVTGNAETEKLTRDVMNLYPPASRKPVTLHSGGRDMLDEAGVAEQIFALASPRVPLDNGANLVIESTEALTVIDVNTGKFTGDDSFEQTVYYTNVLAAREIARQVKLRNIGGIVVVDFIDMSDAAHKKAIVEELERELKKDDSKCNVCSMSRLGLVEFSRKRSGPSRLSALMKPCRACGGTGYAKTDEYVLLGARARLLSMAADGSKLIRIDLNAELFEKLTAWTQLKEDLKSRCAGTEIYAVPHKSYPAERVICRNGDAPGFPLSPSAVKIV